MELESELRRAPQPDDGPDPSTSKYPNHWQGTGWHLAMLTPLTASGLQPAGHSGPAWALPLSDAAVS